MARNMNMVGWMKEPFFLVLLFCLACALPLSAQPKGKGKAKKEQVVKQKEPVMKPVSMFGVGVSFTDSVVYQTEVQRVDSAWITTSPTLLMDRALYSLQLQYYMEHQGVKNSVCAVFFSKSAGKMQRLWKKIRKRHEQAPTQRFKIVPLSDFRFQAEEYRPIITEEGTQ